MAHNVKVLVVGTKNQKKCREMRELLAGLPLEVRSLSEFPGIEPAEENGTTFEENAAAKALTYARATGQWCVADDSGLEISALGNRPGIYSSRWAGREGDDEANNRKLLEELRTVPRDRWQARYVCVAVLASPEKVLLSARGTCAGVITDRPAGSGGFGYDPYFYLPERQATMAELPAAEKHAISHRGAALRELRAKLEAYLKSHMGGATL
jgi:XTP/dITP diphosphohydrolase